MYVALQDGASYSSEALAVVAFITWKRGDARDDSGGVGLGIYCSVW